MKVFHLSHTDLDGYSCQFLAKEFFDDITFYNANYGKEVGARIEQILAKISESAPKANALSSKLNALSAKLANLQSNKQSEQFLILITDLNLTLSECAMLESAIKELKESGADVKIQLLDHHISGEECAAKYAWYKLDESRCATKITFDYLTKNFRIRDESRLIWLEKLVEMVNSIDIWQEQNYGFALGKVAMGLISGSIELNRNMFDVPNREYKFRLIDTLREFLDGTQAQFSEFKQLEGKSEDEISESKADFTLQPQAVSFDNELYKLKKLALFGDPSTQTMDMVVSEFQTKLLGEKKEQCLIFYGNKKGFLSYGLGGVSVVANLFLQKNPEFDFYIDINNRGNVSLRANGNCDVSELSKNCFNGGGHKNASGGKLDGFKESFYYEDIRRQVQEKLDNY